ncbi:hypothetical protein [Geoalkalibacter halelectricus]|uniref:Transposase of IS4/5 family n=1 Tax=Geoalkalibacter halelectricus TaxID=2847045 RepID=A0ABY5ZTL8_9BACT|nr:hypothetical protein [Geoalkalibacter halelectricus]MDO3376978.1 hypothetical protein [Geoalkalibacter halelectricus]UWZ81200.1 hypothetical protein L9S41_07375 [Geoalkalibacter halelectricus]
MATLRWGREGDEFLSSFIHAAPAIGDKKNAARGREVPGGVKGRESVSKESFRPQHVPRKRANLVPDIERTLRFSQCANGYAWLGEAVGVAAAGDVCREWRAFGPQKFFRLVKVWIYRAPRCAEKDTGGQSIFVIAPWARSL